MRICTAFAALSMCVFTTASAAAKPTAAEACGQIIVVSYRGAAAAASSVTRTKPEAKARAETLLQQAKQGDFAALAKTESDAPSSAPRGGIMGTYVKAEWPEIHAALKAPLFKLSEGQLAPKPIEAAYGYVILKRCKVEKAHARHLLIRYAGAKNAKPEITRTRDQAKQQAETVLRGIKTEQDF